MTYTQITQQERYAIWNLRKLGYAPAAIARELNWHPSTIREDWSPEQIVGWCARFEILVISHETIYQRIVKDRKRGGTLCTHLRVMTKNLRKRYGTYDSRGRLAGKRHISTRPAGAENRARIGHWEGDTVTGSTTNTACVLTLVHVYEELEAVVETKCCFSTPHHSWERGSNENANGLIRLYLPKRRSMAGLTQRECQRIADKLNRRPRKRLGFRTPEEIYAA